MTHFHWRGSPLTLSIGRKDRRSSKEQEIDRLFAELKLRLAIFELELAEPSGPPIITPRGAERALFSRN